MPDEDFEKHRIKWEFFKLHANQRLTLFRFYIGVVVALFVAYFYLYDHLITCRGTHFLYICVILAGLSIALMSYLFYQIDLRNVELINNAKNTIDELKELSANEPMNSYTHKQLFRMVFFASMIVGMILIIPAGYRYYYCIKKCRSPLAEECRPIIDQTKGGQIDQKTNHYGLKKTTTKNNYKTD